MTGTKGRTARHPAGPPRALGGISGARPSPARNTWLMRAVRRATSSLCRLTVEGEAHVPRNGAFLLVFNHTSNFDPPILLATVPRADLIGLVAASYRHRPWARFFVEASGSIWLARGTGDRGALGAAEEALASGIPVGLSPEGGRGHGNAVRRARPGVASIAERAGVPIIPAGIVGAGRVSAHLRRGRRTDVQVRFGPPFRPSEFPGLSRKARCQAQADEAMSRVIALLPPDYHGVYADGSATGGGRR